MTGDKWQVTRKRAKMNGFNLSPVTRRMSPALTSPLPCDIFHAWQNLLWDAALALFWAAARFLLNLRLRRAFNPLLRHPQPCRTRATASSACR